MIEEKFLSKEIKNCRDESSIVNLDDNHLGDTIIAGGTNFNDNSITETRDLVLSFPHIGLHTGDEKNRI